MLEMIKSNGIDTLKKITAIKSSMGRLNPIALTGQMTTYIPEGFPKEGVRRRVLDVMLNIGIPFNRWLGLRIKTFESDKVVIESPETVLRRNHVGTAHACALALIGEYPAGLLVAQKFPLEKYRMIIGKLEIEYHKAGRGTLIGAAKAPEAWPVLNGDEAWVEMETQITNKKGDLVAVCKTRWQIKPWDKVRSGASPSLPTE